MTNLAKFFSVANYSVIILREIVRVVGGHGCGWAKLNVLQFVSACGWHCSSFYFAKGWHFVCRFNVRLSSVVSSFRVAANVLRLGVVGLFSTKLHTKPKVQI